jgi:hypothetical protein
VEDQPAAALAVQIALHQEAPLVGHPGRGLLLLEVMQQGKGGAVVYGEIVHEPLHDLPSGSPSFERISPRKRAISMERSNERGSISPVHEGTVGFRPGAERT